MIRRIILAVFTILVGVFLYFGFQKIQKSQNETIDVFELVPVDAVAIIEIKDPSSQWGGILSNNIIWEELRVFDEVQVLSDQISSIDSALQTQRSTLLKEENLNLVISLIPSNKKKLNVVFQTKTKTAFKSKSLVSFLESVFKSKSVTVLKNGIIQVQKNGNIFFVYATNNVLSFCQSENQALKIAKQLESGTSLTTNKSFNTVRKTSSKDASFRVYINPVQLLKSLKPMANSKVKTQIDLMPNWGGWAELDVNIMPDEVSMGGFITATDSSQQLISIFKNQEAIKPNVVKFLPNRTAFILHQGFSDYAKLRDEIITRKDKEMGVSNVDFLKKLNSLYDVSVENDFLKWIDNEIAFVIAEPDQVNFSNDIMLWISSTDASSMLSRMAEMSLKVANKKEQEFYSLSYRGYTIYQLSIPDFLTTALGQDYYLLDKNYFTQIDDYLVFANSPSTLQWTINKLRDGRTLANDPHFKSFENRITAESNIFIYSHIAGSTAIYRHLTNQSLSSEIANYQEWLQKFQVASIQISYENDDLYYVNNYWRYNPVYKKESNSLWELALESQVRFKPTLVTNHYTNATEIFVQDTANNIYLISNKGKVLWKRLLEGQIKSEVRQIDVYKNNKLQLVFNTDNRIYIMDRNGKDLSNFPIILPDSASANMAIMDYDENKNYRMIIPLKDGSIINYGTKGLRTKGWLYTKTSSAASQKIIHTSIKGKDYLLTVFNNGTIKALDRKGRTRINFKSKLNFAPIGQVSVYVGSELGNSYILAVTQNKDVVKVSLDDHKERLFGIKLNAVNNIGFTDVDKDGAIEIIASDSNRIIAYKTDGNIVFDVETKEKMSYAPNIYKFENETFIGYVSSSSNKIYLANTNGELTFDFPKNGSSRFTISDINRDGRFNVIMINNQGLMFAYTLEDN